MHVPALLDALSIPYSGSDPKAVALCYDRAYLRSLASDAGLLVPEAVWLDAEWQHITLPKHFPVLLKPALKRGGEARSILIRSIGELREAALKLNEKFSKVPLRIQEFLPGKGYHVGVFGNGEQRLKAFPLMEEAGSGVLVSTFSEELSEKVSMES